MKVHSFRLSQAIGHSEPRRYLLPFKRVSRAREGHEEMVIDGPFAESKETCLHVTLLAHRMRFADATRLESDGVCMGS
jgi:hypothetical protein